MFAMKTLKAYGQLTRISNLPTVVTNVLVGIALALQGDAFTLKAFIPLQVIVILFYLGGMALNDVIDFRYDLKHQIPRPLATGAITPFAAQFFVGITLGIGLSLSFELFNRHAFMVSCLLVFAIVVYNLFHKKIVQTVVFMGMVRGLVYLFCYTAMCQVPLDSRMYGYLIALYIFAITFYVIGITLVARLENSSGIDKRKWLLILMWGIVVAVSGFGIWLNPSGQKNVILIVLGLFIFTYWILHAMFILFSESPNIKKAILYLLSGICLVDTIFLITLSVDQVIVGVSFICFVITTLWHKKISGT